jgi:hypothetical protein
MKYIFLPLLLLVINSFAQMPHLPTWNSQTIEFSCTQMEVEEGKSIAIFEGKKDSYLKMHDATGTVLNSTVVLKLAEYFEMKNGVVTKAEYALSSDTKRITYTIYEGDKLCVIIIQYNINSTKPLFIVASTDANWRWKDSKKYTITLDEFK